jgi:hypothetical protein
MLSSEKLFQIWEAGLDRPPLARSVAMLRAAGTVHSAGDPATLPIGARDLELLSLREEAFGRDVTGIAACPDCAERVEIRFRTDDVRQPTPVAPDCLSFESGGYRVRFHLPSSADLLSVELVGDENEDGRRILERCVSEATLDGAPISAHALPEMLQEAVASAMAAADPQAEVELALECPCCTRRWTELFDIDSFFWTELQAWAARILREIHQLASAYGWSEHEILALPPLRRHTYLNLIAE